MVGQDEIEPPLAGVDHDRARRVGTVIGDRLARDRRRHRTPVRRAAGGIGEDGDIRQGLRGPRSQQQAGDKADANLYDPTHFSSSSWKQSHFRTVSLMRGYAPTLPAFFRQWRILGNGRAPSGLRENQNGATP